jgi:hypothetical protein
MASRITGARSRGCLDQSGRVLQHRRERVGDIVAVERARARSISYATQPNAQMSLRLSAVRPFACSGLMSIPYWLQLPQGHRVASGRTRDTSWSRNTPDFINTAKCPPPSIERNAFVGARIESTNERARLVGVVKSSAP